MTLLSLILALLLEQLRPLPAQGLAMRVLRGLVAGIGRRFDDGAGARGRIAWVIVVLPVTLAAAIGYWLLWETLPVLAFVFNVVVLYVCMGFRHDSGLFSDIHVALRLGEPERARILLGQWRGARYDDASPSEVARLAIEQGLVASHRSLFGGVFWFVLLPGPSGAVMYRVARELAQQWGGRRAPENAAFGRFAQRAMEAIEWLPVRITASVFSIMGNFEDAMYCWRSQAVLWTDRSSAILIASGGGALGVRLGMSIRESGVVVDRPEMGLGAEAGVEHMQSTVGLLWRALLVCLFLLVLLASAGWAGR